MKLYLLYLLLGVSPELPNANAPNAQVDKPLTRPPAQPCTKYRHCGLPQYRRVGAMRGWR